MSPCYVFRQQLYSNRRTLCNGNGRGFLSQDCVYPCYREIVEKAHASVGPGKPKRRLARRWGVGRGRPSQFFRIGIMGRDPPSAPPAPLAHCPMCGHLPAAGAAAALACRRSRRRRARPHRGDIRTPAAQRWVGGKEFSRGGIVRRRQWAADAGGRLLWELAVAAAAAAAAWCMAATVSRAATPTAAAEAGGRRAEAGVVEEEARRSNRIEKL
jgi:hypothetical protein